MGLQRIVVLQSCFSNKYMRVEVGDDNRGCIFFDGDTVMSPFAKVEFVKSSNSKDSYHIRCCYNNKFWRSEADAEPPMVVAEANEALNKKEEKPTTLFEIRFVDVAKTIISLRSVADDVWLKVDQGEQGHLIYGDKTLPPDDKTYQLNIIGWDSFFVLPRYVAFKGDNGKYLYAWWSSDANQEYNQFWLDDITHIGGHYEVFPNPDGSVLIKSRRYDKFLSKLPNEWISATASDTDIQDDSKKKDCLFWPVKIGPSNKVVLRSLGNNKFCARYPKCEKLVDCLCASESMIIIPAIMEVKELVLSREIFNVNFHTKNARIYGHKVLKHQTLSSANGGEKDITDTLKFSYKETSTQTWSATVSIKLGVETTFTTGIPFIAKGEVKISVEVQGSYTWGETHDDSKESALDHQVIVPAGKIVSADLIATEVECDVPFSYSQRDTLYDGTVVVTDMDDGLFTGVTTFDVTVVTEVKKKEENKDVEEINHGVTTSL